MCLYYEMLYQSDEELYRHGSSLPLMGYAAEVGEARIVKILLDHGASSTLSRQVVRKCRSI